MMAANHAHHDTGVARDEYVDVFAALQARRYLLHGQAPAAAWPAPTPDRSSAALRSW